MAYALVLNELGVFHLKQGQGYVDEEASNWCSVKNVQGSAS